ncbi:MAG: PIN domain-containing protein [Lewinellaceae bacterium]|nr:PIN domain-containing protein [Phaeodactylibacter sp.]MCB9038235.1 PIN domain-containing protein [Lewinellaceae bacterium]
MNYLIDTNILVIYVRDTDLTRRLEENLRLLTGRNNLVISVVSIGEIKSIAKQNKWGEKRVRRLIEILNQFLIADINVEDIIESYSEIDTYSQGKLEGKAASFTSRNMGKNDLWIAATASTLNLELITTDKDFDHLNEEYFQLKRIDLSEYSNEKD